MELQSKPQRNVFSVDNLMSDDESEIEDRLLVSTSATGYIKSHNGLFFSERSNAPKSQLQMCKMPKKSDDLQKRQNFFYQTLNGAFQAHTPTTQNATNCLFSTVPVPVKSRETII